MFGGLLFGKNQKPLKGFKVTSIERNKKYGIAANSLKMLKEKAAEKFKVFFFVVVVLELQWNLYSYLLFSFGITRLDKKL